MHVYVSVAGGASTFERHCDDKDVLLVGGLGKVSYWFDDDKEITLDPGDSLFIEAEHIIDLKFMDLEQL